MIASSETGRPSQGPRGRHGASQALLELGKQPPISKTLVGVANSLDGLAKDYERLALG